MIEKYSAISKLSKGKSLLYIEDNNGLRKKVSTLLKEYVKNLYLAKSAEEGLSHFKHYHPDIIVTDLSLPDFPGIEVIQKIREADKEIKIIITTAYQDKQELIDAIDYTVSGFLDKPFQLENLLEKIQRCFEEIKSEEDRCLFNAYLNDLYNYEDTLTLLLKGKNLIFANKVFLKYFNVGSIKEFVNDNPDFGQLFLKHKGFLFGDRWFETALENADHLFHVKMLDGDKNSTHFVFKLHPIPDKASMSILSLHDITELNLLSLFDEDAAKEDKRLRDKSAISNLFQVIKRNHAEIKLHSNYKGLKITQPGFLIHADFEFSVIKTSFLQLKAIQHENRVIIDSELLPERVIAYNINGINFEEQTFSIADATFEKDKNSQAEEMWLHPEPKHKITLLLQGKTFFGKVTIHSLSKKGAKLSLNAMPAGLSINMTVKVDMVFSMHGKPVIINTDAKVSSITEKSKSFELTVYFELPEYFEHILSDYLAYRQMALIREYKALQYG